MPRNNGTKRPYDRLADATRTAKGRPERSDARSPARRSGEVRIIGGTWRGRKLHFPQAAGLRPTPDRVRETLFNWLQFELVGKRCLDLFAGSGALGFEALSRQAGEVVFVECDAAAAEAIRSTLRAFECDRGRVEALDAFAYLRRRPARPFDVVFLDPPYDKAWLAEAVAGLERGGWLASEAWIYLEDTASKGAPMLPEGWVMWRSKRAGDVGYHLARRGRTPDATRTPTTEGHA